MKTERILGIPPKMQSKLEVEFDGKLAKEGIPTQKPEKEKNKFDDEHYLMLGWFLNNIPEEFRNNKKAKESFSEVLLEKVFQNIWNYKISIPEGLSEKRLAEWLFSKKEELGDLSGINLNLKETTFSENISDEIDKTRREIKFHKSINKCPSIDTYNKGKFNREAKHAFGVGASLYLRQKIMIEKLEEILARATRNMLQ